MYCSFCQETKLVVQYYAACFHSAIPCQGQVAPKINVLVMQSGMLSWLYRRPLFDSTLYLTEKSFSARSTIIKGGLFWATLSHMHIFCVKGPQTIWLKQNNILVLVINYWQYHANLITVSIPWGYIQTPCQVQSSQTPKQLVSLQCPLSLQGEGCKVISNAHWRQHQVLPAARCRVHLDCWRHGVRCPCHRLSKCKNMGGCNATLAISAMSLVTNNDIMLRKGSIVTSTMHACDNTGQVARVLFQGPI